MAGSEEATELDSDWWQLPEPALMKIFSYLSIQDLVSVGRCCKRWLDVSYDDFFWHKIFLRDFAVDRHIHLKPGADSWRSEYIRLASDIPLVNTQILNGHSNEVLHVSFANNGKLFATCSKDATCIIWTATHPVTMKFTHNMKTFCWKYTQWSSFNKSDTAIIISGVHFGSPNSTSGELAVFAIEDDQSYLKCRVVNRPYDIFGTWFSDKYLLSGDLYWLSNTISCSIIWLNKADQETESENIPILTQVYKFYNAAASSVRSIIVADCPWFDDEKEDEDDAEAAALAAVKTATAIEEAVAAVERGEPLGLHDYHMLLGDNEIEDDSGGNPMQDPKYKSHLPPLIFNSDESTDLDSEIEYAMMEMPAFSQTIRYVDAFRRKFGRRKKDLSSSPSRKKSRKYHTRSAKKKLQNGGEGSSQNCRGRSGSEERQRSEDCSERSSQNSSTGSSRSSSQGSSSKDRESNRSSKSPNKGDDERVPPKHGKHYVDSSSSDDEDYRNPKYLIFSTGFEAYTPHQIAIKRMKNVNFPKTMDPGPTLKERIEERRRKKADRRHNERFEPDWDNFNSVAHRFDRVDKIIEMHGHITGMALSPDHRYLYVNCRAWPHGYVIRDSIHPPPIAQEIDIHVIDLKRMKRVGKTYRAHKAFTPNTDCFFIFLNVSEDYVASGAEDRHAYIWDRYYGMCLAKYPHTDVVNCVAFNPKQNDMLITTSDDYSIKIWRSRLQAKKRNIDAIGQATIMRKKAY